jgi:stearoyl-CoA desaturase (delta-9 desaturase)
MFAFDSPVFNAAIDWLARGVLDLSWWQIVLLALAMTHITIASVTIYLHRHQAHRALDLHAIPSHFFRLWLWLTTGMVTKQWAAIHRKHHAKCEQAEDPHSPQVYGIKKVSSKVLSFIALKPKIRKPWHVMAMARRTTGWSATSTPAILGKA